MKWYRKAAEAGDAQAMGSIGFLYMNGWGVPRNYSTALAWFRKAADKGDAIAMRNIGTLYAHGWGVPRSAGKAREWFHRAAVNKASVAAAETNFTQGESSGKQRIHKIMGLYRDAPAGTKGFAAYEIGKLYAEGLGVPKSYQAAMRWYRRAARAGEARGIGAVGHLYLYGLGVPRNYSKALAWLRKAAASDDVAAMRDMGTLYAHGWGVPQNAKKAAAWRRRADRKSHAAGANSRWGENLVRRRFRVIKNGFLGVASFVTLLAHRKGNRLGSITLSVDSKIGDVEEAITAGKKKTDTPVVLLLVSRSGEGPTPLVSVNGDWALLGGLGRQAFEYKSQTYRYNKRKNIWVPAKVSAVQGKRAKLPAPAQ